MDAPCFIYPAIGGDLVPSYPRMFHAQHPEKPTLPPALLHSSDFAGLWLPVSTSACCRDTGGNWNLPINWTVLGLFIRGSNRKRADHKVDFKMKDCKCFSA